MISTWWGDNSGELRSMIPKLERFLKTELGMTLNRNKVAIHSAYRGVEFLGAYLKPFRRYLSTGCLRRMTGRFALLPALPPASLSYSINSCLGITSHYATYNLRLGWISGPLAVAFRYGYFRASLLRYKLFPGKGGSTRFARTPPHLPSPDGDGTRSRA